MISKQLLALAQQHNWQALLAKKNGDEVESLFDHAMKVLEIIENLMGEDYFDTKYVLAAKHAAFLHDLGKENPIFQKKLLGFHKDGAPHLISIDEIKEFFLLSKITSSDLENHSKLVFVLINATHLGVAEENANLIQITELKTFHRSEIATINTLSDFIRAADGLASANSIIQAERSCKRWIHVNNALVKSNERFYFFRENHIRRGNTSILIDQSVVETISKINGRIIAYYRDGILSIIPTKIDADTIESQLKKKLTTTFRMAIKSPEVIPKSFAMVINRNMIGNEDLLTFDTVDVFLKEASNNILSQKKPLEQQEAIYVRFIINLLLIFDKRLLDEQKHIYHECQKQVFGRVLSAERLTTKYAVYNDLLESIVPFISSQLQRDFTTLPLSDKISYLNKLTKNVLQDFFDKIQKNGVLPSNFQSSYIEEVVDAFISEIEFPDTIASPEKFNVGNTDVYIQTKNNLMNSNLSFSEYLYCPICGAVGKTIAATKSIVGDGSKKYMNKAIAGKSLNNIRICTKCKFELTLKSTADYYFFLMPKNAMSPQEMKRLADFFDHVYHKKLKGYPDKIAKALLEDSSLIDMRKKIAELFHEATKSDINTLKVSFHYTGRFFYISIKVLESNKTNTIADLLIFAFALHVLSNLQVYLSNGNSVFAPVSETFAVKFPTTPTLRKLTNLNGIVKTIESNDVRQLLASRVLIDKNTYFNDIIKILRKHPGEILLRLTRDHESKNVYSYINKKIQYIIILMEKQNMSPIAEEINQLLTTFYFPRSSSMSMHSRLGPFNTIYREFKNGNVSKIDPAVVAGKAYRQLGLLNNDDYEKLAAAEEFLRVCTSLKSKLMELSAKERRQYLDNLRYSVYLLQTIKFNKNVQNKKKKNEVEKNV